MAENTTKGELPNESIHWYDALPRPIRKIIREADDEYACKPLVEHFRRSGMSVEEYSEMLGRVFGRK